LVSEDEDLKCETGTKFPDCDQLFSKDALLPRPMPQPFNDGAAALVLMEQLKKQKRTRIKGHWNP